MKQESITPDNQIALLDLETGQSGNILKIGVIRGTDSILFKGSFDQPDALKKVDQFVSGVDCLVGHNILLHDLPQLASAKPDLQLLQLPTADTLFLSPICFPENPYHRLVKDYKLVSESINDPVADSRLSGVLFLDEIQSLKGMAEAAPDEFECLRFLLCYSSSDETPLLRGMRYLFDACGYPFEHGNIDDIRELIRSVFSRHACQACALMISETDFSTEKSRWALAYVLTWLRVAGADSVLPPWVRLHNDLVSPLISRLRDTPCDDPTCSYCANVHNPEKQLKQYFGFEDFRPTPPAADGRSLQRAIIVAGMRNESLLAIMPTGGGKSLCFQLPALIRAYRRGQLTIVVSPLQALMKDQVDGLVRRTGMNNAAALSGLLTPPERGEVLRGIRTGRIGLLYVSPEQLRSKAFKNAVATREIGCWVMDEAHCLSKWGHDFRPDYLYVGRFISEVSARSGGQTPSIACFTATAKRDVIAEIIDFFRRETGTELTCYEGGVERDNLHFEVQTIGEHGKLPRIHDLLESRLPPEGSGSAVVFRSLRKDAEETAAYLIQKNWKAECFHAGLTVTRKKEIQNAFLAGEIRVICATCAFGMGIDKDDVRLVIHGDSPGSLESYLQEAGRAGRDRNPADCVLLYDEEDTEKQFRLGARSSLTRRDIIQILGGLRKAARKHKTDDIVITTGELLRDEQVNTDFDASDMMADTKVRTAVSWLERAGFLERNENNTNVVQGRLQVRNIEEAVQKIASLQLSERESSLWLAVIREMMNANETDLLSVDDIALLPEFLSYVNWSGSDANKDGNEWVVRESRSQEAISAKIFKVLNGMMSAGIMKKDTLLTAYLDYKIKDHSALRLARVLHVEQAFLKLLAEEEPDPESWLPLNLLLINDALISRDVASSTEMLRILLQSLSEDGRGFAGQSGSIELRHVGRDLYRVRLRRDWGQLTALAERRNVVAKCILDALLLQIPPDTTPQGALLVTFSFELLQTAIEKGHCLTLRNP
jgi:ATP-dependent DNA helicase RecQ